MTIDVAVGVITRARSEVLLAWRDASRHQGGCWEFPGGKLEPGETPLEGLIRELDEELGIRPDPASASPLLTIPWSYGDKAVRLHVWQADQFEGVPHGREGQAVRWFAISDLSPDLFPAANRGILRALQLPRQVWVTPDLDDLEEALMQLIHAAEKGAQMVVLRSQGQFPGCVAALETFSGQARALGLRCILHERSLRSPGISADEVRRIQGVDGLHLSAASLWSADHRPGDDVLLGASCHTLADIRQANRLACDYIFLSPVRPTRSHPEARPLGWSTFGTWIAEAAMPVYALGGVGPEDLPHALRAGAQGIAGIRAFVRV